MLAALIPDGPLHPEDATAALVVGLIVGLVVGRRSWAVPGLVVAGLVTLEQRHPSMLLDGILDRPAPVWPIVGAAIIAIGAGALVTGRRSLPVHMTVALGIAACGAVWATAPDTEPALIGGCVLAGALPTFGRRASTFAPIVFAAALIAAVIGTVGRPDQLGLVFAAFVVAVIGWRCVAEVAMRVIAAQRAGTPTTVAPAATSVVTTAPAPTTAP